MHKHAKLGRGLEEYSPKKFIEIRCSEIAPETILGQKWLSMYAFAKPADFEFPHEKVLRLAEQQMG